MNFRIMTHHQHMIPGGMNVELQAIRPSLHRCLKGGQGILRPIHRAPTMRSHFKSEKIGRDRKAGQGMEEVEPNFQASPQKSFRDSS